MDLEVTEHEKLQAFLSRLENVSRKGGEYVASCPAHDDRSPSFTVRDGGDRVIFHCFSGCHPNSILAAMQIGWQDCFYGKSDPAEKKKRPFDRRGTELELLMCWQRLQSEEEILLRLRQDRAWARGALDKLGVGWDGERLTLPIRDKEGRLHDVIRYNPWAQKRKILAGEGRSRQPFPSPERVDGNYVWIVEGEGTAISMASLGFDAVALPGAVSKASGDVRRPGKFEGVGWHPSWAKRFKKWPLAYLIPDSDDVGRTLMHTVSHDLTNEGVHAVILDMGREEKGYDVGDFLKSAKTGELRRQAKTLLTMLAQTAMRQPESFAVAQGILRSWEAWQHGLTLEPQDIFTGNPRSVTVDFQVKDGMAVDWS